MSKNTQKFYSRMTWDELLTTHQHTHNRVTELILDQQGRGIADGIYAITNIRTERSAVENEMNERVYAATRMAVNGLYWDASEQILCAKVAAELKADIDSSAVDGVIHKARREYSAINKE